MKKVILFMSIIAVSVWAQSLNVVENEFIKIITGPEGFDHPRFSIETTGGDPSNTNDDNLPLIYGRPKPWTSYTSIAVEGTVYGFGTQTLKRAGKKAIYGQVVESKITDESMVTRVEVGGVTATQTLSLFRNPLTNVKDAVLIQYDVRNDAAITRNIGLRIMMDTMLGANDAAPFRIGEESIVAEKKYTGSDIMDYWQSFDSLVSPNIIAQGILRYAPAGLTPPDELILMNWGSLSDSPYRVKVKEGASFIRDGEDEQDTALALFFEKRPLGPNQTRRYRTVMGLGGVSLAPGDLALGLTAPSTLAITDPNTYTIIAYVSNTGGFTAAKSQAKLRLPDGLRLVKGSSTTDLGNILSGGSRQLMYVVKVDPKKAVEGRKPISLIVTSDTLEDQVLKRSIEFKGQPRLTINPIGKPKIERGLDYFVDVPVEIINESDVSISNIRLGVDVQPPFQVPSFESTRRDIPYLESGARVQKSWKLKVNEWWQGDHSVGFEIASDYTRTTTTNTLINVKLGDPKAKLYYSDSEFFIGDYGYVWLTMIDMPTFSGLNLRLSWDPELLKPIRVSPQPWLFESNENIMDSFVVTSNAMEINGLAAENPPWRMIIGKWHFKVLKSGDATIQMTQDGKLLDQLTLTLRSEETEFETSIKEDDFDY